MRSSEEAAQTAVQLGELALEFGRVNRATCHEDGMRPETDTDHTVMLALIACELCPPELNRGMVAQFAIVHDLVEARAGDTNSLKLTDRQKALKRGREGKALEALKEEYADDSWMIQYMVEYEKQRVLEARYVRYLDKAMPKITHILNECAAIRRQGVSLAELVGLHDKQLAALNLEYPDLQGFQVRAVLGDLMRRAELEYPEESP